MRRRQCVGLTSHSATRTATQYRGWLMNRHENESKADLAAQRGVDAAERSTRPSSWKWTICGLLLLASAINYMDRQTLANASVRITQEFGLKQEQYGNIEAAFAYAFAAGSLVFGWLADRFSVRWLYAVVLTAWSLAGLAAGFVRDAHELLLCRVALGFFEAGHWPCGVRTTRALLDPRERSLGNGVLQSG